MVPNTTIPIETDDFFACPPKGSRHPSAVEVAKMIDDIGPSAYAYMIIPVILCLIMIAMYVDQIIFLIKGNVHWQTTRLKIWILATYPFMSLMCVIGIWLPRSSPTISFVISFYNALVMAKFFDLIMVYYGGKKKMEETLDGQIFPGNPPPCCFVFCCPKVVMNVKTIQLMQNLIYPMCVFQPLVYFIMTILWEEDVAHTSWAGLITFFNLCIPGSTAVCVYGFVSINRASMEPLKEFSAKGKFLCVQAMIFSNSVQGILLKICDRFIGMPCDFPYPTTDQGFIIHLYVFIYELMVVSLIAGKLYRTDESYCVVLRKASNGSEVEEPSSRKNTAVTLVQYTPSPQFTHQSYSTDTSQGSKVSSVSDHMIHSMRPRIT